MSALGLPEPAALSEEARAVTEVDHEGPDMVPHETQIYRVRTSCMAEQRPMVKGIGFLLHPICQYLLNRHYADNSLSLRASQYFEWGLYQGIEQQWRTRRVAWQTTVGGTPMTRSYLLMY